MWIRSQDKRDLIYANRVMVLGIEKNEIWVNHFCIATYKSRAEAIKVLDMVQERIEAIELFRASVQATKNTKFLQYAKIPYPEHVFQLPEAGFLEEES